MREIAASIIIPVYNREDKIKKCVNSLLNQTFEDVEIIIVDDGSTDSTSQICQSFDDSRVKYIRKENGGVSSARNLGISLARGKYIGFVDSDDSVTEDYFEKMYSACMKYDVDICICDYKRIEKFGKESLYTDLINKGYYDYTRIKTDILSNALGFKTKDGNISNIHWVVWRCWFKRDMIIMNQLLFDETLTKGEDCLFKFLATLFSKSVYYLKNEYLYLYNNNTDSLTYKYLPDYWNQRCKIIDKIEIVNDPKEIWQNQSFLLFILKFIKHSNNNIAYGFRQVNWITSIKEFKNIVNDNRVIKMTENLDISGLNEEWLRLFNWTKNKKYLTLFFFYKDTYGKSRFFHFVRKIQKHFNKK